MNVGSSTQRAEAEFRRQLPTILPRLNRFALALTRDRAEADDVLQAACERAFSRLDQWDPDTRLDSWMFRMIQTIWFNELRARKVREKHADSAQAGQPKVQHAEPEAQLLLLRAEQEILPVPENLRSVLPLVCLEQFSYRDAAKAAAIPIGTVMSRLARASAPDAAPRHHGRSRSSRGCGRCPCANQRRPDCERPAAGSNLIHCETSPPWRCGRGQGWLTCVRYRSKSGWLSFLRRRSPTVAAPFHRVISIS